MNSTTMLGAGAVALACALHLPQALAQGAPAAPAGSAEFTQALARNYQALAEAERQQGDHRDAETYALRAQAAGAGTAVAPDDVAARQPFLKEKHVAALTEARQRLMAGLATTRALEAAPASAARAQTSYDCWLEQATEDLQPADIEACKQSFMTAMTEVENASQPVAEASPPPPPAPPPEPAPQVEEGPSKFLVFFDFDRSEITAAANEVLESFRATFEQHPDASVVATGHADTSGSDRYNMRLSQRRAEAVRAALARMNVPRDRIETRARGESEPLVATDDGVREPQNRRVEITAE
ncbi:MAG: OmpA family protein [Gammaproteobacteria bacterium]